MMGDETLRWWVLEAVQFAVRKHDGQYRKGEGRIPFVTHPIAVAKTLIAHGVRCDVTAVAAILHDVVEDTDATLDDVEMRFGKDVACVVAEVTDDPGLETSAERKQAQIEKAPNWTHRAKLVKIGDKICNMIDLIHNPPGWGRKAVIRYVENSAAIIRAMGPVHKDLEETFWAIAAEASEGIVAA